MVDAAVDRRGEVPSTRDRAPIVLGVVVAVVGWCARTWVRDGAAPLQWNDSADYLVSAAAPVASLDRWAGARPPLMPSLLSLVDQDLVRFVTLQTLVAAVAWGVLAYVATDILDRRSLQTVAAVLVLALSLTWPSTMWDQQVLTESLALSTLVLFAAALLRFATRPSDAAAGVAVVLGAVLALAVRDSVVVPVGLIGAAILLASSRLASGQRRPAWGTGALLLGLCVLAVGAAHHGARERVPIEHVYAVRVLPFPERVEWFAAHGMPDARAVASLPPALDPEGRRAPFVPVPVEPQWARWRAWIATSGRQTWLRFVAAHPGYLASEPVKRPERVFNNGEGLATYRPLPAREVPLVSTVAHPPTSIALVVACGALVVAQRGWGTSRRCRPFALAGAALVGTAAPHALVVWHSDGMESARHLLVPGMQVRLGAVLLVVAAVQAVADQRPARGTAPSPPARSSDHRRAPLPRGG